MMSLQALICPISPRQVKRLSFFYTESKTASATQSPVRLGGAKTKVSEPQGEETTSLFDRGTESATEELSVEMEERHFTSFYGDTGLDPDAFDIIAIKSRAHFRRGFDDNGFAKTILLGEPIEPFLGTVRLDALPYEHVDLKGFYPYGNPTFP